MQISPVLPTLERNYGSAPTVDSARRAPFSLSRDWTPSKLTIFGHAISVDIPTGNLIVSTGDVGYPYYNFSLGISRKYDLQEQHMQLSYLRNYPNVNPKPHWFGNWQFAFEADVDEVWHNTYAELHVTSGVGANGLFEIGEPDFKRNLKNGNSVDNLLRTYGIPGRTLAELGWTFAENDFLLRTLRGPFQIITGHFLEETLVDDIDAEMWLFNPISGTGFRITSEFFFNIPEDNYRDVGYPLTVSKLVDALGHTIELKPAAAQPPFQEYILSDGSGREFHLHLDQELTFLDGLNPGGQIRKHLISRVEDRTKTSHNAFQYRYSPEHLLEEVTLPSSLGNRRVRYHYDNPNYPGVLTAIENSFGDRIQFEYTEDPTDNDERLNPRLKIQKIIDPEGIVFEYEYDHPRSTVFATISQNGNFDRRIKYQYVRDLHNTRQRYITLTEIEVRRGYVRDSSGAIVQRQQNNPQTIQNRTEYTKDGRFNVEKEIDPLGRVLRYEYNVFNQIECSWDFDNHWTRNTYDIPQDPSPANPIRYDLLETTRENVLRRVDETLPARPFIETIRTIATKYKYHKYTVSNSNDNSDHGAQSTHRVQTIEDERQNVWVFAYDDAGYNSPLSPTLLESPLKNRKLNTYSNRGEVVTTTDPEQNVHTYSYTLQGFLDTYTNPNQQTVKFTYYPEAPWVLTLEDQRAKVTTFLRETDGRLKQVIDPATDLIDYKYMNNGRIKKIIRHRPAVLATPGDSTSPSLVTPFDELATEFAYSALGSLRSLKNAKGLELISEYDEGGRLYHWYHRIAGAKFTKFVYDPAGQLERSVDRRGESTRCTYDNMGRATSVRSPDWNDGTGTRLGKLIEYQKYDHLGRLLTVRDHELGGTREFAYDEAGNLVVRRDPDGFELRFSYDQDGRLWKVRDLGGDYELILNLDGLGRPISLRDSPVLDGQLTWTYDYRKTDDPIKRVLNLYQRRLEAVGLVSDFDYNECDLVAKVEHAWSGTQAPIFAQDLEYRDDGLLDVITGDGSNSFRYDSVKQLIYEDASGLTADYDEAGNRLYRVDRSAHPTRPDNTYGTLNQLWKDEGLPSTFTYDDNGNISTSTYPVDPTTFHFDGSNRLRLIKTGPHEIHYLYDEAGKLIEIKQVSSSNGATSEKIRFHYLLSKPIVIERDCNPLVLLTWDPSGALLRVRRKQAIGASSYSNSLFPVTDGLNNVVRLLDGDQNTRASIAYDPWGVVSIVDADDLFDFWGYRGGILDRRSGFVLFGARWYWPEIGRWLSEDPLSNDATKDPSVFSGRAVNLYAYVGNDPVNWADPSGLILAAGNAGGAELLGALGSIASAQPWLQWLHQSPNTYTIFEGFVGVDAAGRFGDDSPPRISGNNRMGPGWADIIVDPRESLAQGFSPVNVLMHELLHAFARAYSTGDQRPPPPGTIAEDVLSTLLAPGSYPEDTPFNPAGAPNPLVHFEGLYYNIWASQITGLSLE